MVLKCLQNVERIFGSIQLIQEIVSLLWLSVELAFYVLTPVSPGVVRILSQTPDGLDIGYVFEETALFTFHFQSKVV